MYFLTNSILLYLLNEIEKTKFNLSIEIYIGNSVKQKEIYTYETFLGNIWILLRFLYECMYVYTTIDQCLINFIFKHESFIRLFLIYFTHKRKKGNEIFVCSS